MSVSLRSAVTVAAITLLSAATAMAQLGGVGSVPLSNGFTVAPNVPVQALSCTLFATPNTVRAEGYAELLGDLGLNCSGALQLNTRNWRVGVDTAPPAAFPQLMNISINLSIPLTSRLVGATNMTEALLFLSDNNGQEPWNPAPGTSQMNQNPCPAANVSSNGSCSNLANLDGLSNSVPTFGNARPTAVGINVGAADSTASLPINVFQGQLQNANTVTFFGVPMNQMDSSQNPSLSDALNLLVLSISPNQVPNNALYTGQAIMFPFTKRFRIKNLRGAIAGSADPNGQVFASVDIQNAPANLQVNSSTAVVGFVQQGVVFNRRTATDSGASTGLAYAQCEDANSNLATDATSATFGNTVQPGLLLRYTEGFANSFKIRGYLPGQPASQDQNDPTQSYSTHSGFYNTQWNTLPNGIGRAGIADHGTRLRAAFGAVPANLRLYVTVANVNSSLTGGAGAYGVITDASGADQGPAINPVTATSAAYSTAGNPTFATFGDVLTPFGPNFFTGPAGSPFQGKPTTNGYVQVPVSSGTAAFTWEVYSAVPYQPEYFIFQVVAAWRASQSPAPGTMTVQGSFAPVNTTATASGSLVPVPRFLDASASSPRLFELQSCVSSTLNVTQVSSNEGNSGTTSFHFSAWLAAPAPVGGVIFDISTANSTALAGSDYVAQSLIGQVIPEGQLSYDFTVLVNGDTTPESNEIFLVNVSNVIRATAGNQGIGTIVNDDVSLTSINTIQGSGTSTPLLGQTVSTTGIVTAVGRDRYFIQTPDGAVDADPNTSEGLQIVEASGTPAAAVVGNLVQVTGVVGESATTTVLFDATATVNSTSNPLPAPIVIAGGTTQLERYEGMRVTLSSLNIVAPTDGSLNANTATATSNGLFYGVFPGLANPVREPGVPVFEPLPRCAAGAGCAIPVFDTNPERIAVDTDAIQGQIAIDAGTGQTAVNLTGVLDYFSSAYAIYTTQAPAVTGVPVASTAIPAAPAGALTVVSMNVDRLYDLVNDLNTSDVVVTGTGFNNRLSKLSKAIRTTLRTPDVIALQEVENLTTAQALATQINNDAVFNSQPNPGYTASLVDGNDANGLNVALLVRSGAVSLSSVTQLERTTTYTNLCTGAQDILNEHPPLRLRGTATKGAQLLDFTIFVNHLSPAYFSGDSTSCGISTVGNNVRARRAAQANNVAKIIQDELTSNANARILVVGDFNSFEVNDGYVDVVNTILGTPAPATQVATATLDPTYPNLTNLHSLVPLPQRYSMIVEGNRQTTDHAMLNPAALGQLVGGGYARLNADFPDVYRNDANRPERYATHDPLFAYLTTATNVTAQTTVSRATIVYNRPALTATTRIMVKNNTANAMTGPLNVVITGLPDGVTLTNANSTTGIGAVYNLPVPLAAGQSVTVTLNFAIDAVKAINYTVNVFAGTL